MREYHEKRPARKNNLLIGLRPLIEAIQSGKEIDKILVQRGLQGELFREVNQLARSHSIPVQLVPVEKLNGLSRANHQGIIAFTTEITFQNLENVVAGIYESGEVARLLMLDGVTDIRNFGAICRTAECAGVQAVIIPDKGTAQINEEAVKSSAGALMNIAVCRVKNLETTATYLREAGLSLVAATEKGATDIHQVDMTGPTCLVMGGEEAGISPALIRKADHLVRIPMFGRTGSLNVSVACGIALYELNRQRIGGV